MIATALGDDLGSFASIFGAVARTGSEIGSALIDADASKSAREDQAAAQERLAVSRSNVDLALARLRSDQAASQALNLDPLWDALALVLVVVLGLRVLA